MVDAHCLKIGYIVGAVFDLFGQGFYFDFEVFFPRCTVPFRGFVSVFRAIEVSCRTGRASVSRRPSCCFLSR
jgi:hypothetical protein